MVRVREVGDLVVAARPDDLESREWVGCGLHHLVQQVASEQVASGIRRSDGINWSSRDRHGYEQRLERASDTSGCRAKQLRADPQGAVRSLVKMPRSAR
jgi:hypothetical protein